LHTDAWGVFWHLPAYPERYAARLATVIASPYLMLAGTLGLAKKLRDNRFTREQAEHQRARRICLSETVQ